MSDDRPNVYVENDVAIYRASSVGNCVKGLVAARLGMEPGPHPDWLLEKFAQGNVNEPIILMMLEENHHVSMWTDLELEAAGYVLDDGQVLVELPVGSGVRIRGHLDGIGDDGDVVYVVEAKAFGESFWDKYDKEGITGFPYYSAQLAIYMAATGLPGLFVIGRKDTDGVVNEIRVTHFDEPPVNVGLVKAKVAKVERAAASGELPGCDVKQYPCQWFHLGGECREGGDRGAGLEESEDLELDLLASQYRQGKKLEKQGQDLYKPAGEGLMKLFEERGWVEKGQGVKTKTYEAVMVVEERKGYEVKAGVRRYVKIVEKGKGEGEG